ncbi:MAG: hypothetical protein WDM77_17640 [Steroidobacteraceae bacterium]
MPISSIDSTAPSVALSMCHSFWIPMEAKLIDITSNPSRAFRPTAMNTTMICSVPMGDLRMVLTRVAIVHGKVPWPFQAFAVSSSAPQIITAAAAGTC